MKGAECPLFLSFMIITSERKWNLILALFITVALYASIRNFFLPPSHVDGYAIGVTHYNNYLIFINSFSHLLDHKDLYISYPNEQYDLFKYTPTAALFFGIFKMFPVGVGLLFWNLINVLLPLFAFVQLIKTHRSYLSLLTVWMIPELVTTTLNSQCNALILGLLLWTLVFFQKQKPFWAAFCLGLAVYLKLFCVVFYLFFLIIPREPINYVVNAIFVFLMLGLLPLMFVNPEHYIFLFKSYFELLKTDGATFVKLSFMGWLQSWFGIVLPKNAIVLGGLLFQMILLSRFSKFGNTEKIWYFSSWLLWVVIFNHMAESATFIIATGGIVLFYVYREKVNWFDVFLLFMVFILSELGPSDLFPKDMRIWIVEKAQLKVFPIIMMWFRINSSLLRNVNTKNIGNQQV